MSLEVGIVGLPNVGKSTLFNTLTNLDVEAANYPFATIEPNVGIVPVPDPRLEKLSKQENSAETIPTIIEFKDIAGLVAGAHKGEGLGNKFLSHIREVDAIIHLVRLFEDRNVTHVSDEIHPTKDIETIETELILSDLEMIEKKIQKHERPARSGEKQKIIRLRIAEKFKTALEKEQMASEVDFTDEEKKYLHEFPLLTRKPILYVANVNQENAPNIVAGKEMITIDVKLEAELSGLTAEEKKEYLQDLGLKQTGLDKLIKASYKLLDLITFFTTGSKETKAWTCRKGTLAPGAAGVIHTDFEKNFIKAEVINWEKLLQAGSWNKAKEKGWIKTEGKNYKVNDGDVMFFKHGA